VGSVITGVIASPVWLVPGSAEFVTSFTNYMSCLIWTASWSDRAIDFFVSTGDGSTYPALPLGATLRYGDVRWRSLAALLSGWVSDGAFE